MGRTPDYSKKFVELLLLLKKKYPAYSHLRNISTAFADYGDIWGMSEKEACYALEKYLSELELDQSHTVSDEYVEDIIADAEHLFDKNEEEEEEEY